MQIESRNRGVISHLKHDNRMIRNYLSWTAGDQINTLLAAAAYNMRKWMRLTSIKPKTYFVSPFDSTDFYTPYLDSFDIYNISSSSDNVRIILSYYMALLQASIKLKEKTNIRFPNLLILDEPKQQN
jgi:hypothetical protein